MRVKNYDFLQREVRPREKSSGLIWILGGRGDNFMGGEEILRCWERESMLKIIRGLTSLIICILDWF